MKGKGRGGKSVAFPKEMNTRTMQSMRPNRQQSLPILPKYQTIMHDLEEKSSLQIFSRGVCYVAVEHIRTAVPGRISFEDLKSFLDKERDITSRHGLTSPSALRQLFDAAQRTYGDYLEEDDIYSAISVRKRIRTSISSDNIAGTPSIDRTRPTTAENKDPLAQLWVGKPGRNVWLDIISRAHLRATGTVPGQLAPGRSVPDLSRPGTRERSRPSTQQRSRPQTRASLMSRQSRPYSRSSVLSQESFQSWASSERSPMPMAPLDRVASAIRVFHRDVASVEKLKDKERGSQIREPARRPGANSVEPLKLSKLGFSQRFQFSRLSDHMNRIQEENEAMRQQLAASAPIGVVKERDINGRIYTKDTLRMQQRTRKKQFLRSTKERDDFNKHRVCKYSVPASYYFAPLQREKTRRQSSFTIVKPPTLEEWQHNDFNQRAKVSKLFEQRHSGTNLGPEINETNRKSGHVISDSVQKWIRKKKAELYESRRERKKRVALEGEEAVRIAEKLERIKGKDEFKEFRKEKLQRLEKARTKREKVFYVPVPDNPLDDAHRLKVEAASNNKLTGELRGELEMKFSFRAKYDPWISIGVRRPQMNLTPQPSKEFGNPPELPWKLGSGAFRSCSKAEGSWDNDFDIEAENGGLEGDGWHAESYVPVEIGGDPMKAAMSKWKHRKEKRSRMISKTRFGNASSNKPEMVLNNLKVDADGDGCFGSLIQLPREPMFQNWRQPSKTGAAAR